MLKLLSCVLLGGGLCVGQSSVTVTISGIGSGAGNGSFTLVGQATVTGLGSAVASIQGFVSPTATSGQNSGPAIGVLALVFPPGDFLVGTFSVPAGVVVPFIGGTTTGTGSITIIGGIGRFQGATGSFPNVVGSGTATGANSSTVQLSGNGTLTVAPPSGSAITRTIAHTGDGNQFRTAVVLTNSDTASASYTLKVYDNSGNVSTGFQLALGALTGTIPPGQSVTIQSSGLASTTSQGWAELTAPASVGGSVIYSQPDGAIVQEGTTTIPSSGSLHFFVPFDNTNGAVTAMAITNSGTTSANLNVTLRYASGTSETVPWGSTFAARSHQSFAFLAQFPHSFNQSGVAEFTSDQPLNAVVFRFNSTGAFTALEIISK